jgi:hypothetical protein
VIPAVVVTQRKGGWIDGSLLGGSERGRWRANCQCMPAAIHVSGVVLVLGLALFSSPGSAETGVRPSDDTTLGVITTFEEACAPSTLREMQLELAEILGLGFHLEWRSATDNLVGETFNYIVTVRFRGHCLVEAPWGAPLAVDKLGATHITDGEVLSFGEVYCNAVRRTAWPLLLKDGAAQAPALLGRALARVVAHEVYHMLAKTRQHARRGLAKRSLTAQDLVVNPAHFGAAELAKVRTQHTIALPAALPVMGLVQGTGFHSRSR